MSIPKSLTLTPLALKARPDGHPPVDATHLDYEVVSQAPRVNWCWASVTAAMSTYYKKRSEATGDWPKCKVVNRVLAGSYAESCVVPTQIKQADCCKSKWGIGTKDACTAPAAADNYGRLYCGLGGAGLQVSFVRGAMAYAQVTAEIDGKRPLGVYIQWEGGGNHMVAIAGYDPANQMLSIADPQTQGDVDAPGHWATMPATGPYRPSEGGLGNWDGTYKTGPATS